MSNLPDSKMTATSGEIVYMPRTPDSYYAVFDDPSDKQCSNCDHPAYAPFSYGPGRYSGFRCVCCFRAMWEETLKNLHESIAKLPAACVQGEAPKRTPRLTAAEVRAVLADMGKPPEGGPHAEPYGPSVLADPVTQHRNQTGSQSAPDDSTTAVSP